MKENYTAEVLKDISEFGYDPSGKVYIELSKNVTMTINYEHENANVHFYRDGKEVDKRILNMNQLHFVDSFMELYRDIK